VLQRYVSLATKPLSYSRALFPLRKTLKSLFVSPLFSWSCELLFPQPLSFDGHLRCPRGCGGCTSFRILVPKCICGNTSILNGLPPLGFSCLSFSSSLSLFSATCGLFLQNTGGWGTPPRFRRLRPSNSGDQDLQIVYGITEPSGRANLPPQC